MQPGWTWGHKRQNKWTSGGKQPKGQTMQHHGPLPFEKENRNTVIIMLAVVLSHIYISCLPARVRICIFTLLIWCELEIFFQRREAHAQNVNSGDDTQKHNNKRGKSKGSVRVFRSGQVRRETGERDRERKWIVWNVVRGPLLWLKSEEFSTKLPWFYIFMNVRRRNKKIG